MVVVAGESAGGAGRSTIASNDANIHTMWHQGQSPAVSEGGILGLPPPPPPPPSSASPPQIATCPTASGMSKRSYFSAGSDGIIGSGGSRGSLSLSGGSRSDNSGRAGLGLGSGCNEDGPSSRYGRYGNSNLELDADANEDIGEEDTVLGAADAVLATSPIGIAASKVELSSYFAAEAGQHQPQQQHGQGNSGTAVTMAMGLEGLSLDEMENDENIHPGGPVTAFGDGDSERRTVTKKPFLRKGSRREPSSLHRFQITSTNNPANKATASLASPNVEVDAMATGMGGPPPPSSATSLEALEKMQQDQMDDLERRMARRREAREMQQRRKRGVHGNAGTTGTISSGSGGGSATTSPHSALVKAPYATEDDDPMVLGGSSTSSTRGDAGGVGRGYTPTTSNKQQQLQRSGGKMTGSNSKKKVGGRVPFQSGTSRNGSGAKAMATISSTAAAQTMTSSAAIRGGSGRTSGQHQRQERRGDGVGDGVGMTIDPAQLLAQQQRNDEQWSLLKSMRRRQEAALRDAEQEREAVRSWAMSEKESVTKWSNEQRSLIRKERHRASTAALASHRERQKEEKQQQGAYEELEKSSREEIATLRLTVDKLRTEMEGAKSKYRMSERKLRDKIKSQGEIIRQLKSEIGSPPIQVSSSTRHGATSSGSNATPTVAFGSTLPREKKQRVFGKKNMTTTSGGTGSRALRDSYDGNAESEEEEKVGGHSNDNDDRGISTEEVEVVIVDKTPAEVLPPKADSPVPINTAWEEEKIPATVEAPRVEDLVEETTEQWMKRLQERHNTLPFGADSGSAGTGVVPPISTTPAPSEKDELLARANQLMSGGSAGGNSVHHSSSGLVGSIQKPLGASLSHHVISTNPLAPLYFGPSAYPIAQQTPDPHLVTSTSIEALGSTEGKRVVSYSNGTTKETLPDGTTRVCFANGDIKTTYGHQNVTIYYYAAAETTHTTHPDGLEVFQFANKQTEKHFPDGRKEVYFVDGPVKMINPDGSGETTFPDGVRIVEMANGTKQIIRG